MVDDFLWIDSYDDAWYWVWDADHDGTRRFGM